MHTTRSCRCPSHPCVSRNVHPCEHGHATRPRRVLGHGASGRTGRARRWTACVANTGVSCGDSSRHVRRWAAGLGWGVTMPNATINGVTLYYEEHGAGEALVWSHEYAGDYRSWAPQVRALSRRYRVITYSNRGYLPSAIPRDPAAYSQAQLVEDLRGLLDHLGL